MFIHGWCCDHTFFEPQVDHFKGSHTVILVHQLEVPEQVTSMIDRFLRVGVGPPDG